MIPRPSYLNAIRPFAGKNIIKVLVGVRRCGKSTLLMLVRNELIAAGVDPSSMTCINFESAKASKLRTAEALRSYIDARVEPGKSTTPSSTKSNKLKLGSRRLPSSWSTTISTCT